MNQKVIDLVNDRLTEVQRIQKDFAIKSREEDYWHGVVGQCSKEEHFLKELLSILSGVLHE